MYFSKTFVFTTISECAPFVLEIDSLCCRAWHDNKVRVTVESEHNKRKVSAAAKRHKAKGEDGRQGKWRATC